jgi:hypothetical protein
VPSHNRFFYLYLVASFYFPRRGASIHSSLPLWTPPVFSGSFICAQPTILETPSASLKSLWETFSLRENFQGKRKFPSPGGKGKQLDTAFPAGEG